jgi:hypothetical protein
MSGSLFQRILAIDPGQHGAMAYQNERGEVKTYSLDCSTRDICEILMHLPEVDVDAYIENVGGYRPGNSGPASVKFARSVGILEGALIALDFPLVRVAPQKWMKALGSLPKDKAERKRKIKALMQERFPKIKVTLGNADALGILVWAIKENS